MPNTILVVEDYADARRLYKLMLEKIGYRVLEAGDGYEAIEQALTAHPDLVLMDMSLPGMDGLTATRQIKDMSADDIPVIGITAHGNLYNDQALNAGCDTIVSKPVEIKMLSTLVSMYVSP